MESLAEIVTWFFALDHTHYSRWLSVHIRDMMMLSEKQPGVLVEFKAGKFFIFKTSNKFSAMAIDQCHEQNDALVKGSGGAIGLTGNPGALRRWTVAGPEIVQITKEFEGDRGHSMTANQQHHDQQPGVQQNFLKDVTSPATVIDDMRNPFLEKSHDLLVLDTKNIMDASVVESVRKIKSLGLEQYKKFVEERSQQSLKPITETLSKNNLPLFSRPTIKSPSKEKLQLVALKKDRELFMRLYVACQTRGGDLDQFFSHEIQAVPPALSCGGKQRIGTKADLLHCFESCVASKPQSTPEVDAIILDGAVVVHMLHPGTAKTFQEYADFVFGPYISSQIDKTSRVDVVWDVYLPGSLKRTTRQKRGKGVRRRVSPSTTIPKSWKDFLRVDDNKTELFKFLAQLVTCHLSNS